MTLLWLKTWCFARNHLTRAFTARREGWSGYLRRRAFDLFCVAVGELWGLQVGVAAGFYLVSGDLMPEHLHHVAWYLSLSLCSSAGGAGGWLIAKLSRNAPALPAATPI